MILWKLFFLFFEAVEPGVEAKQSHQLLAMIALHIQGGAAVVTSQCIEGRVHYQWNIN